MNKAFVLSAAAMLCCLATATAQEIIPTDNDMVAAEPIAIGQNEAEDPEVAVADYSSFSITDSAAYTAQPLTYTWPGGKQAWRHEFSYAGLPLMGIGLMIWGQQDDYRSMRNHFIPKFSSQLDNYSQYSPLALTAVLKACGAETRSNWGRFAVSSAFSAAIMATLVNSVKYTVKEMRPDNSTRNSFPSGHTATAFMSATIMSKELGWRSPWYSIGAYSVAATTGLFRVFNNRHWINDIVFGAGVGITSVDLGYFITDLIFKDKGINARSWQGSVTPDLNAAPSFVSFGMSVGTGTNLRAPAIYDDYVTQDDGELLPADGATPMNLKFKMGATTSIGAEGAYFFNSNWGVGGRLRATAAPSPPNITATSSPIA